MPRASMAVKDTVETSLRIQEGWVEVADAAVIVHRLSPNKATGETYAPSCAVMLKLQRTDRDGQINGEPTDEAWGVGGLEKFRPGQARGPEDQDPEDLGTGDGTRGNCLYAMDGAKIDRRTKWFHLAESLEQCGFKPDILGRGFMPDFVGLRGHVKTKMLEKGADFKGKRDPAALVFDKVTRFPYEQKSKATTEAAPADIEAIADAILNAMVEKFGGETVHRSKLTAFAINWLGKSKAAVKDHKAIQALLKGDWFTEQAQAREWTIDGTTVTFIAF